TPAGRPIYRALGFNETWGYHRLAAEQARPSARLAPLANAAVVSPVADSDWAALCAYDARVFGADRSALLGRLRHRLPPAEWVAKRGDRIVGFLLGRDGLKASQVGPLIAEDEETACALLARALAAISGPIYGDFA